MLRHEVARQALSFGVECRQRNVVSPSAPGRDRLPRKENRFPCPASRIQSATVGVQNILLLKGVAPRPESSTDTLSPGQRARSGNSLSSTASPCLSAARAAVPECRLAIIDDADFLPLFDHDWPFRPQEIVTRDSPIPMSVASTAFAQAATLQHRADAPLSSSRATHLHMTISPATTPRRLSISSFGATRRHRSRDRAPLSLRASAA